MRIGYPLTIRHTAISWHFNVIPFRQLLDWVIEQFVYLNIVPMCLPLCIGFNSCNCIWHSDDISASPTSQFPIGCFCRIPFCNSLLSISWIVLIIQIIMPCGSMSSRGNEIFHHFLLKEDRLIRGRLKQLLLAANCCHWERCCININ